MRECHVCGERAGKHSYYGGQVCKHFISDRTISLPISSRRRSLRNDVPGLPVLPGVLPSFSPVWLQRHLLLHQGRQLRGHPQDQEELPVLQIQVRTFKKDAMKTSLLAGPIQSVQCTDLKLVEWIEYRENIRSRRKTQNIGQGVIQHYELYYKFTRSIFSLN